MLGSIIGDIVGSIYEFNNIKTKSFPFFSNEMEFTDDSILTLATADWLLHKEKEIAYYYADYAIKFPTPMGSYGTGFIQWRDHFARLGFAKPYNSCGNGSAMRIGPVGWAFDTLEETLEAAKQSAECTHNHPEGIKGAQAVATAIFMSRKGYSKEEIRQEIVKRFAYQLDFTCEGIRSTYGWGGTCQDSVPQAIVAFLDGHNFEDCIRNAISIGGDSDTIGCITGAMAEAFHGIPLVIREKGISYLPAEFKQLVTEFEARFGNRII